MPALHVGSQPVKRRFPEFPPAPDLQTLVERFGGYDKITPERWAEHDEAMHQWHRTRPLFTCGLVYQGRKPRAKAQTRRRT
jgi:hypothetical protein